ncbi:hypothetical protein [Streptomyces sp. NPDC055632]
MCPGTGPASNGASAGSGSGARRKDRTRPPHRIDLADDGRWAGLITPSPAPSAGRPLSAGTAAVTGILGGEFEDIVYVGRGDAKFAMEETPPPGYVLVDVARTGSGVFWMDSLDWNGREAVHLGRSFPPHGFDRRVMWCDSLYPLRFRVQCDRRDEWVVVIRPLSVRPARPEKEKKPGLWNRLLGR